MIKPDWLKRLVYRKLPAVFLVCYLITILLFILTVDQTDMATRSIRSIRPSSGDTLFSKKITSNHSEHIFNFRNIRDFFQTFPVTEQRTNQNVHVNRSYGDFIVLGREAFVYSAYVDDRKEPTFIRVLTLFSENSARAYSVYCHFNDTLFSAPRKAIQYELCENHGKKFGGYFYSCSVPDTVEAASLTMVLISLTKFGPRVYVPVLHVQPEQNKLFYLNKYPGDIHRLRTFQISNNYVPSSNLNNTASVSNVPSQKMSFAICVSPIFGLVSVFRLIEFIELSKILGAQHIYFYNYSLHETLDRVLQYYVSKELITVLPWTLPSEIDESIVWYQGQLLSNNDCLYRTMSKHDLVAFNDIDEFIIPHLNGSTWRETFGQFLRDDQCGLSFQSAFFETGDLDPYETRLFTPNITTRTKNMSQVRTKVMVCPWRVFEVGIHHVSKQNRDEWRSLNVDPSIAYLHHYRRCASGYGMNCFIYDQDTTVADRYSEKLTINVQSVITNLYELEILKTDHS